MMLLHAYAVAQKGSAGYGARRVHGDHAHGLRFRAEQRDHVIAQRAFARARWARDAQNESVAGAGGKLAQK
jgi:hypothetical protein